MEQENNNLIVSGNQALNEIVENDGLSKGYVSPKRYYGTVLAKVGDKDCIEHVNEDIFFAACRKLGLLFKAKVYQATKDKPARYELSDDGKYLPPEGIAMKMIDDQESEESFYIRHRGNWGINIAANNINDDLLTPLIDILCKYNKEALKLDVELEDVKDLLREKGMSVAYADASKKHKELVHKFFA